MMAPDWNYRVVVRGGPADEKFTAAIAAAGLTLASGHGAGVAPPGGELPEVDTWAILLHANTAEEAEQRVADAVKGLNSPRFIDSVKPFGS